jgi:uncharacterized protein YggL (DUF469 family)
MYNECLGLLIVFRIVAALSPQARNVLIERFVDEAIEKNRCQFGGGGLEETWSGFAEPEELDHPITDTTRAAIDSWLSNESQIANYFVSEPFDLNDEEKVQAYLSIKNKMLSG